jgi:D-amino-acid dehydrogenase
MVNKRVDAIVLGAGMVGVAAALHLQARGRSVALVDRHAQAGEETSFGNAGLIERSSIFPYMFPREPGALLRYAFNRSPEAHYHLRALPGLASWLLRYWLNSSPEGALRSATAALPLIERSLSEHEALMQAAGAMHLLKKTGWMKLCRSQASFDKAVHEAERLIPYGRAFDVLDRKQIEAREPFLKGDLAGAVHLRDPGVVTDPGGLAKAYAALFIQRGGEMIVGDAGRLTQETDGWSVPTEAGRVQACDVVAALGPWSDIVFRPLGYRIPLAVKRGYHMHYAAEPPAVLNVPVLDVEGGYVLAPMLRGIRLTTGAEFARRDDPPTPVQLARTEPLAREIFPLGARLDAKPWMGSRPCLPDMLPIIGPAPRHPGLWFDFGHQHHGFTLGPVSGRLIADLVTGVEPFTDPSPYSVTRFE